jgi:hypothetical protein
MTTTATIPAEYISAADTARIIRRALKREFPGKKFTVRSSTYSMGSEVSVGVPEGVSTEDVRNVVGGYATGGFDGMIDLAYSITLALDSEDRVIGSASTGTVGSRGSVPAWNTLDTYEVATRVTRYIKGGAKYIFVSRNDA